jgi:predicted ester cyclase
MLVNPARPGVDAQTTQEMRNLVADGDYIALHFTVTGSHRGAFQGIEATGY